MSAADEEPTSEPDAKAEPVAKAKPTKSDTADDGGLLALQLDADEVARQGFIGRRVDPLDNREWSLETGPDSPSLPDDRTQLPQYPNGG